MKILFHIKKELTVLFYEVFNLIFKKTCIRCSCVIQDGILCKNCAKLVQKLEPFAQGKINGYKVFSCFYYEDIIKELIHRLKFKHQKSLSKNAAIFLCDFIDEIKMKNENINFENPVIIPVPTHIKNFNKRGYDNVLEVAKELSALCGYRVNFDVLKKSKYTISQYKISAKERKSNIEGSFELDKNFKTENLVILLDDIVTTGSTLDYITSLFKRNGIENLICLTLSKTRN